jgi:branched-subunit amino acid transport protein
MSDLEFGILIALLTLATVFTRSLFFLLGGAFKLAPWLEHALRYAPAAALAAILAPDLLVSGGSLVLPWTNLKLMAAIVAAIFFLATRHLLGTIIVGMAVFTGLRLLLV